MSEKLVIPSVRPCTLAGIEHDLVSQLAGVTGAELALETLGAFAVEIRYRWWVPLTFGIYRRRAERVAWQIVKHHHTAVSIEFLGIVRGVYNP